MPTYDDWKYTGKYENIMLDGYMAERFLHFVRNGYKPYAAGVRKTKLRKDGKFLTDDEFHKAKL